MKRNYKVAITAGSTVDDVVDANGVPIKVGERLFWVDSKFAPEDGIVVAKITHYGGEYESRCQVWYYDKDGDMEWMPPHRLTH